MSRYIDADKITYMWQYDADGEEHDGVTLQSIIRKLPTADVVEVVRCKDCEWWTKQKDSAQGRCTLLGIYPTGAWYCGNGRRNNND